MQDGRQYSIGLHPAHLQDHEMHFQTVQQLAGKDEVVAIGECGLDKLVSTSMSKQTAVFIQHIQLANTLGKPLIIHCVQAHEELLQVFRNHPAKVPVIIHGFNKRNSIAEKFLAQGFYLSFGVAILNIVSPATDVLKHIKNDRFFLETDDADVSIDTVYSRASEIRDTPLESLILQLEHNYKEVFNP
jgi:TatD DNase family protein